MAGPRLLDSAGPCFLAHCLPHHLPRRVLQRELRAASQTTGSDQGLCHPLCAHNASSDGRKGHAPPARISAAAPRAAPLPEGRGPPVAPRGAGDVEGSPGQTSMRDGARKVEANWANQATCAEHQGLVQRSSMAVACKTGFEESATPCNTYVSFFLQMPF